MAKIRVYELAKELDKDNKSLEEVIRGLGIPIKNYMSTLSPDEAERVRRLVGGGTAAAASAPAASAPAASSAAPASPRNPSPPATGPNKRSSKTVIRRRGAEVRRRRAERAEAQEAADAVAARATGAPMPPRPVPSETARPAPNAPVVRTRPSTPAGPPPSRAPSPVQAGPSVSPAAAEDRRPAGPPPAEARAAQPLVRTPGGDGPMRPEMPHAAPPKPRVAPERSAEAHAPAPTPGEDKKVTPAVGSRIELPKGSRRLPGGMAARLEQPVAPGREARESGREPVRQPEPMRERAQPVGPRPGMAAAGGSAAPAAMTSSAAASVERQAPPPAAGPETGDGQGGRRVVRNEEGVIVGAASQRSEPKILGFIPLAPARKRQQVIITDATEEDKRGRASQRKQREERAQAQGRRRKMTRKPGKGQGIGPSRISTAEMSEEKKRIRVDEAIQVSDLAHQMGQKASNVLRTLWNMGMRGITINNAIDHETAELVAAEFGYTVENVAFQEDEFLEQEGAADEIARAPVVTMMGHVDHGKTSLLDHIRKSRVAAAEAGGITQHIGAYKVSTDRGEVVFLDTPGHEAFTAMRARGAQVTDIVVLVVAADDGVMPTTVEAIKHAREARTPLVVAINKIDKPEANPGRVKQALMEQGIVGEEFGGDTPIVEVSAKTGQGIDELLETLVLQAEVLELSAPIEGRGRGVVLEARIDKGRGTVATVLIQSGMIRKGDIVVASEYTGKVRGLYDASGRSLSEAGPSTPVEVLGLSGVPDAGDIVNVVENERDAKTLVGYRREQRKRKESVRTGPSIQELLQRKKTPVLKLVLKSDVQGSAQALKESLENLSTEKVKVEVIKSEVGQINETDVKYARAGDGVIFGFNVKTTGKAAPQADAEGVPIHTFSVIYDATEKCKELMVGLLEPEYREREQGEAEVRALFPIPRLGVVAGCRVTKGLIQRTSHVRVVRDGDIVHQGVIGSLRVHKDDVREVKDGFECGIVVEGFPDVQEGDRIQAFDVEAIPPTL